MTTTNNCVFYCSEDEENVKALFRRGLAKYNLGQEEGAMEDFEMVKSLDPGWVGDVDREVKKLLAKDKRAAAKQTQQWKGMF